MKKPRGAKHRNLTLCGGVIYYERVVHKRRIRISTKTSSWDEAAAVRDLYEQRKGIGSVPFYAGEVPRFADFAKRYTAEDTAHLEPTTAHDRKSYLREEGPLQRFFGARRLDEIDAPLLRTWWNLEIQGRKLSTKTGRSYLDVLAGVLGYAQDLGILGSNPIRDFRDSLRRRARTQRGRAEAEPGRHIHPIEDPAQIQGARGRSASGGEGCAPLRGPPPRRGATRGRSARPALGRRRLGPGRGRPLARARDLGLTAARRR